MRELNISTYSSISGSDVKFSRDHMKTWKFLSVKLFKCVVAIQSLIEFDSMRI